MTSGSLSPEQWTTIQELFHRALELSATERDAFLDSACADDLEIHREVRSLLDAHERGGPLGTLEPERGADADSGTTGEPPDRAPTMDRIGPYFAPASRPSDRSWPIWTTPILAACWMEASPRVAVRSW